MQKNFSRHNHTGFTLVELALVIMVIGLIAGGVLAGSSLIQAAQLRKTSTQIHQIETGVQTFRIKYNFLPGDLPNPQNHFGAGYLNASAAPGHGNGNGVIEGLSSAITLCTTLCSTGEPAVFFHQLFNAGYIGESMRHTDLDPGSYNLPAASINTGMFMRAALGRGVMFAPFSAGGHNHLLLFGPATGPAVNGAVAASPGLTPLEALNIDGKLDDGKPTTGIAVSTSLTAPSTTVDGGRPLATPVVDGQDCYQTDNSAYLANFDKPSCNLSIRASF